MALSTEQAAAVLRRLQILIPGADADLLEQLITDEADFAQGYTNRTEIPNGLLRTVGDLAMVAYNRRGTEGESARSEGGESYTFETAPAQIYDILRNFRLVRAGGSHHETTTNAG